MHSLYSTHTMNAHIELINTRHHNIDRLSSCFALNVDSQIMHVPHKYSVCVCARARFFFFYLWFSSSAFIIYLSLSPSLFFNRQHSCIRACLTLSSTKSVYIGCCFSLRQSHWSKWSVGASHIKIHIVWSSSLNKWWNVWISSSIFSRLVQTFW